MTSQVKSAKPLTAAERNTLIQLEKNKATEIRLLKEISRPKILIQKIPEKTKPTSFYLEQAKQKFHILQQSKSTRSVSARKARFTKTKICISQKLETRSFEEPKIENSIPDWLNSRPDFQETVRCFKNDLEHRIPLILEISYYSRTAEDLTLVVEYLLSIPFFQTLPVQVVREAGKYLIRQNFKEGQKILKKGDDSDGLIVIYKGSVEVVIDGILVAVKGCGEVVGEMSLNHRMRRSADVIASTDCIIFKLKQEDYESSILATKRKEKQENNDLLKPLAIFKTWSHLKLMRISSLFNEKTFEKNDSIFKKNDPSLSLFFIKSGTVEIFAYVPVERSNKWPVANNEWRVVRVIREHLVKTTELSKGQYFGDQEVIKGSNRVLKAVAKTKVTVLELNREHLFEFFSELELETLAKNSFTKIPEMKELKESLLNEIHIQNSHESALLNALQVNLKNVEGRDLGTDLKTKKLSGWIASYKSRKSSSKNLKKKIVVENSRTIRVKKMRSENNKL